MFNPRKIEIKWSVYRIFRNAIKAILSENRNFANKLIYNTLKRSINDLLFQSNSSENFKKQHDRLNKFTMRKFLPLAILLLITITGSANTELLKGTPFGSTSVDYSTGTASTTVNTPADAFDDDFTTYYASYDRSNTWVGLDLGKPYVIKSVSFCPRQNWGSRLQLGIFEGANKSDFSDALPIAIIKTVPDGNVLTSLDVSCSLGFRYVRFRGPSDARCNIAELKFYGEQSVGDSTQFCQMTNLPLLVINTNNYQAIDSKEVYVDGMLSVISNDGKTLFTDTLKIRGRGNASWLYPKKPYKIKLAHKTHLLGMPAKAKDWTLINNWGDKTLIRNLVAFETSRRFKMDYTPAATLVNVIVNGEYEGCYQLCDQLEVGKKRINITEMDSTCVNIPEITGGYLVEIDAYASSEPKHFSSNKNTPVTIKYPKDDEITNEQFNYIKNSFNAMEAKIYSSYYTDDSFGYITALDVSSFIKHFLVGEFSGNTDTYWSTYLSKDRGSLEKFKAAAVWDFDLAFENDARTYPINNLTTYMCMSSKASFAGDMKTFVSRVANTQTTTISKFWSEARDHNGFTWENMSAYVDSLVNVIDQSQQLNFIRWPILNQLVHQNFQALGTYQAEVDFMKNYIKERFDWMDNKIGYIAGIKNAEEQLAGTILGAQNKIVIRNFPTGASYNIFTMDGKVSESGTISAENADVNMAPGFYIVKVTNTNGVSRQQKVMVQ